jgi:hypothetical protein
MSSLFVFALVEDPALPMSTDYCERLCLVGPNFPPCRVVSP